MTTELLRCLAISGSLRAASGNTAVLGAAARLAPPRVVISLYDGLGTLPHFNPDLDREMPPPNVEALRRAVGEAAGLIVSSPEYAHGMAGAMKNALDWLVRSLEFPGKPLMLINASPRAIHAEAQIREVLTTMSARIVEEASLALPILGRGLTAETIAGDPSLAGPLEAALRRFVAALGPA